MKATILDTRIELDARSTNESSCYLCRIVLEEYIKGLPATYREYSIQRNIVKNVYLDDLVKTVLLKKHIPPIVLVVEKGKYKSDKQSLNIQDFKILDGLQRTHRLKIIYDTALFYLGRSPEEKTELAQMRKFAISRKYSSELRDIDSSTNILFSIVEFAKQSDGTDILECFNDNFQWFEIWANLTLEQEVQKMLVLNAGHKPVNTRHQLELLFLNILPSLKATKNTSFKVVREKEQSVANYSKNRQKGQFHFAHLIAALLSYSEGRPVTTDISLIQNLQNEPIVNEQRSEVLSLSFLEAFISFLIALDGILESEYGHQGITWLGREASLVGLLGALGSKNDDTDIDVTQPLLNFLDLLRNNPAVLNLSGFEEARREALDPTKVNIGSVNKTSVYEAVKDLVSSQKSKKINWTKYF